MAVEMLLLMTIHADPTYKQPIPDPNEKSAGTTQPKWLLGISNSVKFKNLTLSFMFDIKVGGIMWNGTKGALCYIGRAGQTSTRGDSVLYTGVQGHLNSNGDLVHNDSHNNEVSGGVTNSLIYRS